MRSTHARVPTGIRGLDEILSGGFNRGNVVLIEGAPGTGKSTLGLEIIYRGAAEFNDSGLVVSFEVSPEKIVDDVSGFGWSFTQCIEDEKIRVISTTPTMLLEEVQSPDGVLMSEVRSMGAKRILIDGLASLRTDVGPDSERRYREQLTLLVDSLRRYELATFLTNEVTLTEASSICHERFICDTIVSLKTRIRERQRIRSIEVTKSRGQNYITGEHTLRISEGVGVEVHPRFQTRAVNHREMTASTRKVSIGDPKLDQLLGGGLYEGSVTMAVGISGSGKTLLGNQFLLGGVENDERGLLVTLDEQVDQILRNADSSGLPLSKALEAGKISILHELPLELDLDLHFERIIQEIEKISARRIVIDSVGSYEFLSPRHGMDFISTLGAYLKNQSITAILNYESNELLGINHAGGDLRISHLVDNVVLLSYAEVSTELRRAITISKVRGSEHARRAHEFEIGQGGLRLIGGKEEIDDQAGARKFSPQPLVGDDLDFGRGSVIEPPRFL